MRPLRSWWRRADPRASRALATLALGACLALAACGDAPATAAGGSGRGAELFRSNCAICHGAQGEGSKLAPTLRGKARYWKREELLAYLREPKEYAEKVPRLVEQGKRYTLPMTTFKHLPPADLDALADQALALD